MNKLFSLTLIKQSALKNTRTVQILPAQVRFFDPNYKKTTGFDKVSHVL